MSPLPVSEAMQHAINDARVNGAGHLKRYPGGYWKPTAETNYYHGTSTVEALVRRGLAEYNGFQEGKNGKFPTEVRIK